MFGSTSQLSTTGKHTVIKTLSTVQTTRQCSARGGGAAEHLIDSEEFLAKLEHIKFYR